MLLTSSRQLCELVSLSDKLLCQTDDFTVLELNAVAKLIAFCTQPNHNWRDVLPLSLVTCSSTWNRVKLWFHLSTLLSKSKKYTKLLYNLYINILHKLFIKLAHCSVRFLCLHVFCVHFVSVLPTVPSFLKINSLPLSTEINAFQLFPVTNTKRYRDCQSDRQENIHYFVDTYDRDSVRSYSVKRSVILGCEGWKRNQNCRCEHFGSLDTPNSFEFQERLQLLHVVF